LFAGSEIDGMTLLKLCPVKRYTNKEQVVPKHKYN